MIKSVGLSFLFLLLINNMYAQSSLIDSLKQIINQNTQDSNEVNAFAALGISSPQFTDAANFAEQGLSLARKIDYKKGEADCNFILSSLYGANNNTIESIRYAFYALDNYQQLKNYTGIASAHLLLQGGYREAEDYNNSLLHAFIGEKIAEANKIKGIFIFPNHRLAPLFLAEISQTYVLMNRLDSALMYAQQAIEQNELFDGTAWEFPVYLLATIQQMKGNYSHALENYRVAVKLAKVQPENAHDTLQIYSGLSSLFKKSGQLDSSIYYAEIVQMHWKPEISETKNLLEAVKNLYEVYKLKGDKDSTVKYLELNYNLRDSIFSTEKQKQIQEATFNEQIKQQELIAKQIKDNSRLQSYLFTAGIIALILISGLLIRNNSNNKKAKMKIAKAYSELKSTQAQLIQSEKMASLGELTAGIAHEIQNPLNFVNNFSEVNRELISEMKEEIAKGKLDEVKIIASDIEENEEKILHHGKRADSIVKGMLQHSRVSTGQKELTDINALCDEYLRLSYHGLRAKDKQFNATIETDFDESIDKINIVPQDIGRVLLNLFNNAFYAVNERQKAEGVGYEPIVTITTKKVPSNFFGANSPPLETEGILISVKDNGNGIPQKIVDKIFQPFFTTKPTGQGTGLGLSLSYDIIKAHGGEIKVESKEGEGSEFIIQLPIV